MRVLFPQALWVLLNYTIHSLQVDGKWPPQHHYTEMLLTQAGSESSDGSVTYHIPTNTSEGCVTCHTSCHSPARKSDLESASGSSSNGSSAAHEHWVQKPTEDLSETIRKPIAWIWVTISLTIFIICTIGVTRSTWFTNSRTQASIGLVKHCRHQWQTDSMKCDFFKGGFAVKNLPSISWKVSLVLYLIGDALLGAGALVSLLCLITTTAYTRRQITFFAGYFQLFAGKYCTMLGMKWRMQRVSIGDLAVN